MTIRYADHLWLKQPEPTPVASHCRGCGMENPRAQGGWTFCCGKRVCYGGPVVQYVTETIDVAAGDIITDSGYVAACCAPMAEKKVDENTYVLYPVPAMNFVDVP